jgi:hypothetical protein
VFEVAEKSKSCAFVRSFFLDFWAKKFAGKSRFSGLRGSAAAPISVRI